MSPVAVLVTGDITGMLFAAKGLGLLYCKNSYLYSYCTTAPSCGVMYFFVILSAITFLPTVGFSRASVI